jgi:ATP-dependent DNA helicase RecG
LRHNGDLILRTDFVVLFRIMKLKLDTSLIDFSKLGVAGLSAAMAKKFATAIASYSQIKDYKTATVDDMLAYFPMRYEDRSNMMPLDQIKEEIPAAVELFTRVSGGFQVGRNRKRGAPPLFIFEITASDRERKQKPVVVWWFVSGKKAKSIIHFWKEKFAQGTRFIAYGKWEWDTRRNTYALKLAKPDELEVLPSVPEEDESDQAESRDISDEVFSAVHVARRVPVYRKLGDFQSKRLREIFFDTVEHLDSESVDESLPGATVKKLGLLSKNDAIKQIHFPPEKSSLPDYAAARSAAHRRLIFEEFFWLTFALRYRRGRVAAEPKGPAIKISNEMRRELDGIVPFELTNAQKRVVEEVLGDMASDRPMNRLLQGDVGSGKTIVAFMSAYCAYRNGYQTALMAPTEILAEQHYKNAVKLFEGRAIRLALLTGSLKAAAKRAVHKQIQEGDVDLIIGTHALIQDSVVYKNLGLAVIDEQHRFGVAQRAELRESESRPDILVMTATPIPRSLAMTVYGDLEVSTIDELPPGRTPIKTVVVAEDKRKGVYKGIEREVAAGRQVYIVYPLIEESEKLDLKAAADMFEDLSKNEFPDYTIGLLHGRMKSDEKDDVMSAFVAGETDILVSTTVIEVGVDVPNATLMIVEHAERFGLSQLHQLRGRVGRGGEQSFCVLLAGVKKTAVAKERLGIMEESVDGFAIAEKDLELRGQGDIVGTRQSGIQTFRLANIVRDLPILIAARDEAESFFENEGVKAEKARLIRKIESDPRLRFFGVG